MKITIANVLKNEVTVSGQTLSREYVENIMLPVLVAQCATVKSPKFEIVKAFDEAGLWLAAIPEVAREYRQDKSEKAAEKARLLRHRGPPRGVSWQFRDREILQL